MHCSGRLGGGGEEWVSAQGRDIYLEGGSVWGCLPRRVSASGMYTPNLKADTADPEAEPPSTLWTDRHL